MVSMSAKVQFRSVCKCVQIDWMDALRPSVCRALVYGMEVSIERKDLDERDWFELGLSRAHAAHTASNILSATRA